MRRFAVGILIALILPLTACTIAGGDGGYRDYPRYGGHYPPPSDGRWRWDDDLRVYSSVGSPYLYYHDHTYYRWYDNRWSSGSRFNGPWRVIEHRHVPSRLGQRHRSVQRYDDRRVPDRYWNNRDDRSDRRDPRDLRDYRGQSELQRRHDERRDLRQGQQWQQPRFERQDRQVQQPRFEQRRREVQQRFEGRQDRQPQQQRLEQQRREIQQRSEGRQQPQWQRPREERRAQQRGDERRQESRQLQQGGEPRQRNERRAVTQSNQDGGHERRSQSRPQQERQGGRQWEGRGGER